MKLNCWLIFGTMLSSSLLAQQVTNPPPAPAIETPAAAPALTNAPATTEAPAAAAKTNAPAAKAAKKKSSKKKSAQKSAAKPAPAKTAAELPSVPLVAGPAMVVASNVNVRGQAKLNSEVVTKVTKGQEVTVLEEIVHNNSGPTEPSAWAKIVLPPSAHVWVNTSFLNADKTVKPSRLKLRSGPGENYSVLGMLSKGDAVKEVTTKGEWTQIEAPTNAFAFVAAVYLRQEGAGAIAAANTPTNMPTPPEPPTTSATVAENPTVAPPPSDTNAPTPPTTAAVTPTPTNAPTVAENSATNAPETKPEEPLPPRIVSHEGIVRGLTSIQAPSHFALVSADNGNLIDYLYTPSSDPNADLRRWKGAHVVVTGEEGLDERWGNTPVMTIKRIQVVDEPAGK